MESSDEEPMDTGVQNGTQEDLDTSAHLGLGFMVPRQNWDRNEFHKTSAKTPYFHRKFVKKDVGRVLFNPACVGCVLERFLENSFLANFRNGSRIHPSASKPSS